MPAYMRIKYKNIHRWLRSYWIWSFLITQFVCCFLRRLLCAIEKPHVPCSDVQTLKTGVSARRFVLGISSGNLCSNNNFEVWRSNFTCASSKQNYLWHLCSAISTRTVFTDLLFYGFNIIVAGGGPRTAYLRPYVAGGHCFRKSL